ncbi:MAG: GmrSD restriction endonuclease domain-containing protein [Desulfocucumaceae bacterium]
MKCSTLTIAGLRDRYKNGQIELDPPYQRKPAWKTKQRLLLLSSLFNGIPIPALILHKHFNSRTKKDIYDVLDGKQRVETILHFIEYYKLKGEDTLYVEFINQVSGKKDYLYYKDLQSKKVNKAYENILQKFWSYELPIIEYEGELCDFFERNVATKEIFVRINSTGSPLKKHEIRHAQCAGPYFELGDELEKRYSNLFVNRWRITSKSDLERYILHEFILELCSATHLNSYSDRRKKLDEMLSSSRWSKSEISYIRKYFNRTIEWINDIFHGDSIRVTRFKNKSDFYSLFIVLLNLLNKGYVTNDRRSNRIAGNTLIKFSKQIQMLDPKIKAYDIPKLSQNEQRLFQYVISTRQSTDSIRNRETRHNYLMSVLKDGFILRKKDLKRTFDLNVKDLLWTEILEKSNKPKCSNPTSNPKCKKYLTYDDAEVDHMYPWSKGGLTSYANARLICSSCNRSKGDR